jgi:undecaprenyl phosphate N,N'-diacetylbacillosamine 1-phosphate transferase
VVYLQLKYIDVYTSIVKPFLDRFVALLALVVALPLFIFAMVLIAIANRGRVWFIQARPGKDGKIFKVIKFKTMTDARDQNGDLLPDAQRLTKTGAFIRKTSLDELPQLLNIIHGDMSFVGPRPLLIEYLPLYSSQQMHRHKVKPGITGWAQVNGRNAISWQEKFNYDLWYVENISFLLDIRILFMTALRVLKAEGISSGSSVTMEKFAGNN